MKNTDISFLYVPLSRVRRLQDVTIMKPFDFAILLKPMNSALKKMMVEFKERDTCKDM